MKRMRSLIQIVHYKIDPDRLGPRRHGELILVPLRPRKPDQREGRIMLCAPGRAVEKPVRNVVEARELLDLGIDDVRLLRLGRNDCADSAGGGNFLDINVVVLVEIFRGASSF